MADSTYHAGTITVTAGGSGVLGTLTAFLSQVKPGDLLIKGDSFAVIEAVPSNTGLSLATPWPGDALTDEADYLILRTGVGWHSAVEINTRLTAIVAAIEAGLGFKPDATGTLTDRATNNAAAKGFVFVRTDVVPFQIYIKASATSGDWAGPTSMQGPPGVVGPAATVEVGAVETLAPGSAATVTNTGSSSAAEFEFGIPAGADGLDGEDGENGLDGFLPGRRFAFSTTTSDVDPGAGKLAFNHATIGSATTLFIDNAEASGVVVTTWLDSFDDSTNTGNRGSIFLQHGTDISSFAEFIVTGPVADGGGYRKVPVTLVGTAGSFSADAPLVLSFTRSGDKGSDGLGAGDIIGPASATDGALALFDGVTGKLLKSSTTVPSSFGLSLLAAVNQPAALIVIGALPLAGGTMTGALTLNADPSSALHAASKQYVDNVAAGLDIKPSVRLATTANDTLSGLAARDGVTPGAGDRVLVKAQTAASANGIYVAASGAWARAADMDNWLEVPGANVWVEEGTVNGDTAWVCASNAGGTLGTTAITWSQFGGAGVYQPASTNLTTWSGIAAAVGAATFLATPSSANLAAMLTDETGTGSAVFSASPALTGTPTAPTATAGTNTTQVATTAFVGAAIVAMRPTSTIRPVGYWGYFANGGASIANNATMAGSSLSEVFFDSEAWNVSTLVLSGTWRNVSGQTIAGLEAGIFVRES